MNNRPENTPEPQHPPKSPLSKIRLSNAFYPILIGLGAVGYMLWKDFDIQVFSGITFSWHMVFWLVMAVVFMFGRDIGYIIRIRILSNNQLSWRQAFRVIMLWELKVFKLKFLRRWYHAAGQTGTDIIRSSHEIRRYNYKFWLKACSSTFLSWSSRYLVANALIMAFFAVSDQFLLFARQLVIWIMMLVMPTPGGSGFAVIHGFSKKTQGTGGTD